MHATYISISILCMLYRVHTVLSYTYVCMSEYCESCIHPCVKSVVPKCHPMICIFSLHRYSEVTNLFALDDFNEEVRVRTYVHTSSPNAYVHTIHAVWMVISNH